MLFIVTHEVNARLKWLTFQIQMPVTMFLYKYPVIVIALLYYNTYFIMKYIMPDWAQKVIPLLQT